MLQMYKTIFVIVVLMAATSAVVAQSASAYTATIMTNEMAHVVFANNGTSVDKPLVQYDFKIGPQGLPFSVTMIGQ
jgi:hypothetical protein